MKRILVIFSLILATVFAYGQNAKNDTADSIIGSYTSVQGQDTYKLKVTRNSNGSYKGQIFWVADDKDSKGNKRLDTKNPDKSLRNVPCDRIVLFDGLKYRSASKDWGDTKIYDPQRGIQAKLVAFFDKSGTLKLKGSLMGLSETVTLTRLED